MSRDVSAMCRVTKRPVDQTYFPDSFPISLLAVEHQQSSTGICVSMTIGSGDLCCLASLRFIFMVRRRQVQLAAERAATLGEDSFSINAVTWGKAFAELPSAHAVYAGQLCPICLEKLDNGEVHLAAL